MCPVSSRRSAGCSVGSWTSRAGRKTSHWTWFVFPANAGAGSLRSKLIFHPARNQ
ncbi:MULTISPECIES: DUF1810 family protein [Pseudomonas]|uniref:DUF1810 domain-containing protein n=1 Tax=Pseudomonas carnis TaxID=2487355 RepID=A0ABT5RH86_9PSED|nr:MULTISPECIES: DUF1810 family protein [Pseudomonas]MCP9734289.1 DUF1810 domain-containing protein [Pseudomonas sp. GBPI_506]MDD1945355.1 DUF1810 domain-containing protein [Pseudomonas carnis]MDO3690209.1 DUF1810 family protein [Pseudomonas sp. DKN 2791]MDO7031645.1 DUF1810 family protein [Pseudomonas sp. DKN 2792]MDW8842113.1 DUF1810 family protein [Pseudomonas carnis]